MTPFSQIDKVTDDSRFVTALARGLTILACFDKNHTALSHQQICQKTGLPKATISRLLFTLITTDFLTVDDVGVYRLGLSALRLGQIANQQYDVSPLTLPLLRTFAQQYQVSVNIATHHQGMMRYVACYRSPARIAVNLEIGSQVPLEQTAIGRAFFAVVNEETQQKILNFIQQRVEITQFIDIQHLLQQQSEFYQTHHYCVSDGSFMKDIIAIAVAILPNEKTEPIFTINVSVPKSQWDKQQLIDNLLIPLQNLAKELATILPNNS